MKANFFTFQGFWGFVPRCKTTDVKLRQNIKQESKDEKTVMAKVSREFHEKKVEEFKAQYRFINQSQTIRHDVGEKSSSQIQDKARK